MQFQKHSIFKFVILIIEFVIWYALKPKLHRIVSKK